MKFAHKKDYLADCNYDVAKYILDDNYYQITKQFTTPAIKTRKHFTTTFFAIFIPTVIFMVVMVVIGIYYQASHSTSPYFYNLGMGLWITGLAVGIIIEFITICWFFSCFNQYVGVFNKLIIMGCIVPNYGAYPILIQNALFMLGQYPEFNFNNFWITTTNWWLYGFAVFFEKLNEYYATHHLPNVPVIANQPSGDKK